MPLPISAENPAEEPYRRVVETANIVRTNLTFIQAQIDLGKPVAIDILINLYVALNGSQRSGLAIQGAPGLVEYAKVALSDPDYDIEAEFMVAIIACKAVTDWLVANLPNDGQLGFVGWRKQVDGTMQRVTIDPADLAPLSALIAAALATLS